MKVTILAVLMVSSLCLSQTTKSPGHPSHYASVGKKYGKATTVNTPNTNALASELTKIEQQGVHAPASSATQHATSAPAAAKTAQPTQSKNRPMKFTPRAQQGSRTTQPH